jgi:hypothetical protein
MRGVRFLWIAAFLVSCASTPDGSREDSASGIAQPESSEEGAGKSVRGQRLREAPIGESAILVELFTSQGCSSCPPADELLGALDARLEANIIALSFHVDYWNYIGWRDPYSSKRWSSRQKKYARKISNGRGYTPQLVVNGAGHAVGSRFPAIKNEVEKQYKSFAKVFFEGEFELVDNAEVKVTIETSRPDKTPANLMVALYESGLQTSVTRGENQGQNLRNDFVVRDLQDLGVLAQGTNRQDAVFAIDSDWQQANLGVVVFAQDPQSLRVVGAQRLRPR